MKPLFPPLQYFNLPNLLTSLSIVCGLLCPLMIYQGHTQLPAVLYLLAIGLDYIDGIIARKLKQESDFGMAMDSLCDVVNFGAIPAIIGYMLGMRSGYEIALLCTYALSGAWRLSYYSTHGLGDADNEEPTFTGLIITLSASYFLITVIICQVFQLNFNLIGTLFFAVTSVLMVSSMPIRKKGLAIPVTGFLATATVLFYLVSPYIGF